MTIYHKDTPAFLEEAARAPELRRLMGVGMNCGCEYTAFPRFQNIAPYSRYQHSLGVGLIVWHFGGDGKSALAGLLHDIATPCFAHVVDFLNGDHLRQESTEDGTRERIAASPALLGVLEGLDLDVEDVADYHRYPIADNDTPRLSADRLEYTLGNLVNFGFMDAAAVRSLYDDLTVTEAEDGAAELAFRTPRAARAFCRGALACSEIYVSDEDRYSMQCLAELIGEALQAGCLARDDLWRTEPEVIDRLTASDRFAPRWRAFRAMSAVERAAPGPDEDGWRTIPAKKRWIDPLVAGRGRSTALFSDYRAQVEAFLTCRQDERLRARNYR